MYDLRIFQHIKRNFVIQNWSVFCIMYFFPYIFFQSNNMSFMHIKTYKFLIQFFS
jgi:hypothetical protein